MSQVLDNYKSYKRRAIMTREDWDKRVLEIGKMKGYFGMQGENSFGVQLTIKIKGGENELYAFYKKERENDLEDTNSFVRIIIPNTLATGEYHDLKLEEIESIEYLRKFTAMLLLRKKDVAINRLRETIIEEEDKKKRFRQIKDEIIKMKEAIRCREEHLSRHYYLPDSSENCT